MIYLDNAATSWPKPTRVLDEMTRFLAEDAGNPGRGGHRLAVAAERVVRDVRARLATLFHADLPDRIIHCSSCTDALNMAFKGLLGPGHHVITTALEHNSVSRPLQALADAGVITLTRIASAGDGRIDPDDVRRAIAPATKLIAATHASNVTGLIQPIAEIGRIAREHDIIFLVDAAQTAGLVDIDVLAMNIDLLAFPGHKSLLGPAGTGGLYVATRVNLHPWREGGTGGDSGSPIQPTEFPHCLEAGTHNTVGLAGLNAALSGLTPAAALAHEQSLVAGLVAELGDDSRFTIFGKAPATARIGLLSIGVSGLASEDVAAILDQSFSIAVRAGLHCAPYTHRALGTFPDGAVRISPGWKNTVDDITTLAAALREIAEHALSLPEKPE